MSDFLIILATFWSIIYIGFAFAYFGFVHLNSVFTFEYLTVTQVPYYVGASQTLWPTVVARYSLEWWLLLLDYFDFLVPTIVVLYMFFDLKGIKSFKWVALGYLFFDAFLHLRFIYRIVSWAFCDSYGNFCRSNNPAATTTAFGANNSTWLWIFWFEFATIVGVLFPFFYIATLVPDSSKGWRKKVVSDAISQFRTEEVTDEIITALEKKKVFDSPALFEMPQRGEQTEKPRRQVVQRGINIPPPKNSLISK